MVKDDQHSNSSSDEQHLPLLQGKKATCNTGCTLSITGKLQDQVTQKNKENNNQSQRDDLMTNNYHVYLITTKISGANF